MQIEINIRPCAEHFAALAPILTNYPYCKILRDDASARVEWGDLPAHVNLKGFYPEGIPFVMAVTQGDEEVGDACYRLVVGDAVGRSATCDCDFMGNPMIHASLDDYVGGGTFEMHRHLERSETIAFFDLWKHVLAEIDSDSGIKPAVPPSKIPIPRTAGEKVAQAVFEKAHTKGLSAPQFGDCSDGSPVIVDTATGECYRIGIKLKRIK